MTLTDAVCTRLRGLASADPETPFLRVAVLGGSCSGSHQDFSLVAVAEADDSLLLQGVGGVLVDPVSAPFLAGAGLDWRDAPAGTTLELRIPDAAARCGFGVSFAPA